MSRPANMKIQKFGGSSLSTPATIRQVGNIVLDAHRREPVVAVVSAFQGVTNQLIEAARIAERADVKYRRALNDIARRHRAAVSQLVGTGQNRTRVHVDALLAELASTLEGVHLLRHCPLRALDMTASFGERLSAVIVAGYLNRRHPAAFVDARDFVVTDDQFTHANVNFKKTNPRGRRLFKRVTRAHGNGVVPVVTGFIGATEDGQTTTIGRNGSDYSAAIVGAALGASVIEIWTDVDGVLSADPRVVPSAFVLPQMTYEEAMELSYFGAKVLHSATIAPAVAKRIPILIKNTFKPDAPGTLISTSADDDGRMAKGITSVGDLSLLTLRGPGMVGVPGVAERLFRALAARRVSVVLISQASSEHTICFGVRTADAALAFVGVGNVGSAVLRQLHQQREYLLSRGFDVTVVGLANSTRYLADANGVNLASWKELLRESSHRMEPTTLAKRIAAMELTNGALVDCTVGPAVVDAYPAFIDANLHIITPNKWANALPWNRYTALMALLERRKKHFLFEANVGAGLPIVSTLRDLIASGDEIVRIDGILSGTLSYLFNTFEGETAFSTLVAEAHRNGFTEPDPREDLSGNDVARKLLILARMIGLKMDLKDVEVDSLVPAPLTRGAYSDRFLTAYASYDKQMVKRVAVAAGC